MDENAQYFILALYWFVSSPITGKFVHWSYQELHILTVCILQLL